MASTQHLFISTNGDMLPRWRSAFVLAEAVPIRVVSAAFAADYAWLRLQGGVPLAQQVETLRRHLPDATLIVNPTRPLPVTLNCVLKVTEAPAASPF